MCLGLGWWWGELAVRGGGGGAEKGVEMVRRWW